jgi:hypothetical protein
VRRRAPPWPLGGWRIASSRTPWFWDECDKVGYRLEVCQTKRCCLAGGSSAIFSWDDC